MTKATTNKFSPEVRERAVRMVLDHAGEYPTRWAAVVSIAAKTGCAAQTLHDWTKGAGRVARPFGFALTDPGMRLSRTRLLPRVTRVMRRSSSRGE